MKLGKLPARPGAVKLQFKNYSTALITPPSKYGRYGLVSDWQGMLGNDQYGDCVWAGADHEHIYWNKEANKDLRFTSQNALDDYAKCTGFKPNDPNTDQGTDMQVAASYRLKTGIGDAQGQRHKIGAYVALIVGNEAELKQAIFYFGAVGIGIQFPASAMAQFNTGKNWTIVTGSKIEGGHYVPAVGYDSRYIYVVTWGKLIKMSWAFFRKYNDESIVYLDTEMMTGGVSLEGFNISQLTSDLAELK